MATQYRDFKGIVNPSTGDTFVNPKFEEALYVNGELQTPDENGVITLASQASYVIKGRHYGKIVIGASTETSLSNDTFVTLDGVEIYANDATAYGIYYASQSQTMYVTLAKNKRNLIVCEYEQEMASDQGACLFSEKNMVVQGSGYLTCVNKGGHGVRASELTMCGNPHVFVEAVHDAIHGNSELNINGGFYYVTKANDAFGTGTSGDIKVFGGTFRCYGIAQNAFDSQVAGYWFCDTLDLQTDAKEALSGLSKCDPETYFGTASVKNGSTAVTPVDGVYNISTGNEPTVHVEGYIDGSINISVEKTKVSLEGAYITGQIIYTPDGSNLQVESDNNEVNIVMEGVVSANNVKIESKGGSHLVIKSSTTHAVSGSEVVFHDSKGNVMCSSSASDCYGAYGNDIYIADSSDHKGISDEGVYGYIYIDHIYAHLSKKGKKGNLTVCSTNLCGSLVTNKITALTPTTADSDNTGVNLQSSKNVFYGEISAEDLKNDCGKTYEPYDVIPYGVGTFPLY